MEEPKRYSCGNGEGMFDSDKGYWISYKEHQEIVNKIEAAISVTRCSTQFVCEHRWTHNTHSDTKYCSKGCDGFKIHEAN